MLAALLGLLAIFLAGRCILSFLPAGRPGEHALAAWPITWATSHALGTIVLGTQGNLLGVEDWRQLGPWLPWLLLGLARLASLPGAMVPRHRVQHEARRWTSRFMLVATAVGLAAYSYSALRHRGTPLHMLTLPGLAGDPERGAMGWLAVLILIDHGLKNARRAPLERSAWVALSALLASQMTAATAALEAALGAAFLIPWMRNADRRACALSAVGWAALLPIQGGPAGVGTAGLLTLCLGSRTPQRNTALIACACAVVALGSPLLLGERLTPARGDTPAVRDAVVVLALTLVGWTAFWIFRGKRRRRGLAPRHRDLVPIQGAEREVFTLSGVILLSLLGLACVPAGSALPWAHLFPSAVLLSGLAWIKDERQARL